MIKLYIMYLLIGCYLFIESLAIYSLSFLGTSVITDMAVIASLIICPLASGLSLFNIKFSLIAGFIGLIGVFPFGIHWLIFRYQNDYFTILDTENTIIYIAVILYFTCLGYTVIGLISNKQNSITIKKPQRLFLSSIVAILFGLQIFIFFC